MMAPRKNSASISRARREVVELTDGNVGPVDSFLTGLLLNGHGCVRVETVKRAVVVVGEKEGEMEGRGRGGGGS